LLLHRLQGRRGNQHRFLVHESGEIPMNSHESFGGDSDPQICRRLSRGSYVPCASPERPDLFPPVNSKMRLFRLLAAMSASTLFSTMLTAQKPMPTQIKLLTLLGRPLQLAAAEKLDLFSEFGVAVRSEEHTSELQSRGHLVCRLLLEKKK